MNGSIKSKYAVVWIALVVFIVFLSGCLLLINSISSNNEKTMTAYLHDVTIQRNMAVVQHIKGTFQTLEGVSASLSKQNIDDKDAIIEALYDLNKGDLFVRMGIIDLDGKALLVDSSGVKYKGINLKMTDAFSEALNGHNAVTETFYEEETGEYVNYYMVPVYKYGKMVSILCGVESARVLERILDVRVFRGEGYFIAVDQDGKIVTPSSDPNPNVKIGASIFDYADISEEQENRIRQFLKNNESDEFIISAFGNEKVAVSEPVGANDWSLISVVPRDILNSYFGQAAFGVSILAIIVSVLFIFLLIWQIRAAGKNEKKLMDLAYNDQLTGLRNYNGFYMELEKLLKVNNRPAYAMWKMDIKGFNIINDLFGNETGDRLLQYIAKSLKTGNDIAARISADNFLGVRKYNDDDELKIFKNQLYDYIKCRNFMPEKEKKVDFAIGFYIMDASSETLTMEEMVSRVTIAKKNAKNLSGSNYSVFSEEMSNNLHLQSQLEAGAEDALKNGELFFVLQPKVSLKGGYRVVSAEVLARWNHREYGIISPADFIPIFEKNGFIVKFDRYIFRKSCEWYVEFRRKHKLPLDLAINVSRQGLIRGDMVEYYVNVKNEFSIPNGHLELEFTESVITEDFHIFKEKVIQLQEAGFICSIDDFGAGYSSLNVLKNLPIDVLKLDAAFASNLEDKKRARIIVSDFIALAHKLGIITVSEGIETEEQVKFLVDAQCDLIQGYAFSKPLMTEEFEKYLTENKGKVKIIKN